MKFGGDKGHGSFKFNMQLCNTDRPNSQKSTVLVSMCMAGDSSTNLHVCLDMYKEQISELQGMQLGYLNSKYSIKSHIFNFFKFYSARNIIVFMSGDYEFLCRIYGLSGASGN